CTFRASDPRGCSHRGSGLWPEPSRCWPRPPGTWHWRIPPRRGSKRRRAATPRGYRRTRTSWITPCQDHRLAGRGNLGQQGQGESEHTPVYSGGTMVGRAHRTVASPIAEFRIGTIPRGTPRRGGPVVDAPRDERAERKPRVVDAARSPRGRTHGNSTQARRLAPPAGGPPPPGCPDPTPPERESIRRGETDASEIEALHSDQIGNAARSIGADAPALRGTFSCP